MTGVQSSAAVDQKRFLARAKTHLSQLVINRFLTTSHNPRNHNKMEQPEVSYFAAIFQEFCSGQDGTLPPTGKDPPSETPTPAAAAAAE